MKNQHDPFTRIMLSRVAKNSGHNFWNGNNVRLGNIQLGVIGWLIESDQDIFQQEKA